MKIQFHRRIVSGIAIPALSLPLLYSFSSWGTAPALANAQPNLGRDDVAAVLAAAPSSGELAGLDDISSSQPAGLLGEPAEVVIQSSGAIEADVDAFRALLGDPNNGGTPGQQDSGRREINWDGVPAAVTDVPNFPPDFFNVNSKRGLVYNHASPGLEVSDASFTDINPTYAAEFTPFSGQKLFSPIGSNQSDIQFFVAGSDVEAPVRGFGVVFSDVDVAGSTGIVLFSEEGRKLGRIRAPVRTDARGASFVGVVFRNPVIGRVLIVSGNGALSPLEKDVSQGGLHDLVVMDDFLYGEPTATH
jgi:hypothetical protein